MQKGEGYAGLYLVWRGHRIDCRRFSLDSPMKNSENSV